MTVILECEAINTGPESAGNWMPLKALILGQVIDNVSHNPKSYDGLRDITKKGIYENY